MNIKTPNQCRAFLQKKAAELGISSTDTKYKNILSTISRFSDQARKNLQRTTGTIISGEPPLSSKDVDEILEMIKNIKK